MFSEIAANTGRFLVLVFLQGVILTDVNLWQGMAIPYLYVLFLLMLPINLPKWTELIIGLICGLAIDMFTNTLGIHASACVLLAFVRPLLLKAIAPRDGYEFGQRPTISDLGTSWYFKYAFVLVFIHHLWLFYLEVYSFSGFFTTLLRVILSSLFTFLLVILSQYLFFPRKSTTYV